MYLKVITVFKYFKRKYIHTAQKHIKIGSERFISHTCLTTLSVLSYTHLFTSCRYKHKYTFPFSYTAGSIPYKLLYMLFSSKQDIL